MPTFDDAKRPSTLGQTNFVELITVDKVEEQAIRTICDYRSGEPICSYGPSVEASARRLAYKRKRDSARITLTPEQPTAPNRPTIPGSGVFDPNQLLALKAQKEAEDFAQNIRNFIITPQAATTNVLDCPDTFDTLSESRFDSPGLKGWSGDNFYQATDSAEIFRVLELPDNPVNYFWMGDNAYIHPQKGDLDTESWDVFNNRLDKGSVYSGIQNVYSVDQDQFIDIGYSFERDSGKLLYQRNGGAYESVEEYQVTNYLKQPEDLAKNALTNNNNGFILDGSFYEIQENYTWDVTGLTFSGYYSEDNNPPAARLLPADERIEYTIYDFARDGYRNTRYVATGSKNLTPTSTTEDTATNSIFVVENKPTTYYATNIGPGYRIPETIAKKAITGLSGAVYALAINSIDGILYFAYGDGGDGSYLASCPIGDYYNISIIHHELNHKILKICYNDNSGKVYGSAYNSSGQGLVVEYGTERQIVTDSIANPISIDVDSGNNILYVGTKRTGIEVAIFEIDLNNSAIKTLIIFDNPTSDYFSAISDLQLDIWNHRIWFGAGEGLYSISTDGSDFTIHSNDEVPESLTGSLSRIHNRNILDFYMTPILIFDPRITKISKRFRNIPTNTEITSKIELYDLYPDNYLNQARREAFYVSITTPETIQKNKALNLVNDKPVIQVYVQDELDPNVLRPKKSLVTKRLNYKSAVVGDSGDVTVTYYLYAFDENNTDYSAKIGVKQIKICNKLFDCSGGTTKTLDRVNFLLENPDSIFSIGSYPGGYEPYLYAYHIDRANIAGETRTTEFYAPIRQSPNPASAQLKYRTDGFLKLGMPVYKGSSDPDIARATNDYPFSYYLKGRLTSSSELIYNPNWLGVAPSYDWVGERYSTTVAFVTQQVRKDYSAEPFKQVSIKININDIDLPTTKLTARVYSKTDEIIVEQTISGQDFTGSDGGKTIELNFNSGITGTFSLFLGINGPMSAELPGYIGTATIDDILVCYGDGAVNIITRSEVKVRLKWEGSPRFPVNFFEGFVRYKIRKADNPTAFGYVYQRFVDSGHIGATNANDFWKTQQPTTGNAEEFLYLANPSNVVIGSTKELNYANWTWSAPIEKSNASSGNNDILTLTSIAPQYSDVYRVATGDEVCTATIDSDLFDPTCIIESIEPIFLMNRIVTNTAKELVENFYSLTVEIEYTREGTTKIFSKDIDVAALYAVPYEEAIQDLSGWDSIGTYNDGLSGNIAAYESVLFSLDTGTVISDGVVSSSGSSEDLDPVERPDNNPCPLSNIKLYMKFSTLARNPINIYSVYVQYYTKPYYITTSAPNPDQPGNVNLSTRGWVRLPVIWDEISTNFDNLPPCSYWYQNAGNYNNFLPSPNVVNPATGTKVTTSGAAGFISPTMGVDGTPTTIQATIPAYDDPNAIGKVYGGFVCEPDRDNPSYTPCTVEYIQLGVLMSQAFNVRAKLPKISYSFDDGDIFNSSDLCDPIDIVLAIDCSTSMVNTLDNIKENIVNLLDYLEDRHPSSFIGVVQYGQFDSNGDPIVVHPLAAIGLSRASIINAVNNITITNGSIEPHYKAINKATELFDAYGLVGGQRHQLIIFASDEGLSANNGLIGVTEAAANLALSKGYKIVGLYVGPNDSSSIEYQYPYRRVAEITGGASFIKNDGKVVLPLISFIESLCPDSTDAVPAIFENQCANTDDDQLLEFTIEYDVPGYGRITQNFNPLDINDIGVNIATNGNPRYWPYTAPDNLLIQTQEDALIPGEVNWCNYPTVPQQGVEMQQATWLIQSVPVDVRAFGQNLGPIDCSSQQLFSGSGAIEFSKFKTNSKSFTADECVPELIIESMREGRLSNDIQTIVLPNPTSGTWTLRVRNNGTINSAILPFNATPALVQQRLSQLANVGDNNVIVTGNGLSNDPFIVEFQNDLGGRPINLMTSDSTDLRGTGVGYISSLRKGTLNERQTLTNINSSRQRFRLMFGEYTTNLLDWNTSLNSMQAALEGLLNIGAGNIRVTGTTTDRSSNYSGPWIFDFVGDFAAQNVPKIISTNSDYEVVTIWSGGGGINEIQLLTIEAKRGTYTITIRQRVTTTIGSVTYNDLLSYTTNPIQYDAKPSEVFDAIIDALGTSPWLDSNNFAVRLAEDGVKYELVFRGDLWGVDIPLASVNSNDLAGEEIIIAKASSGGRTIDRQRMTFRNTTEGSYRLNVNIPGVGPRTTTPLDFRASSDAIRAALTALEGLDTDNTIVVGSYPVYNVIFFALGDVDVMTALKEDLICDGFYLPPVLPGPHEYNLYTPLATEPPEPEPLRGAIPPSANKALFNRYERYLFESSRSTIRQLASERGISLDDYNPYRRVGDTLSEVTLDSIANNRDSYIFISKGMDNPGEKNRIISYLNQSPGILPSRSN